jgi:orotate phosphoribosyltransferase-like protein
MNIDEHRLVDGGIIQGAEHTSLVLNHKQRNKYIIKAVCDLRKISDDFDSVSCCGTSGLLVVPQISELLNKNILIVRKPHNEKLREYSEFTLEGVAPKRYVIIDDLICSGKTIRYIMKEIKEEHPHAICVGVYCYMRDSCGYRNAPHIFERDFKTNYLNP